MPHIEELPTATKAAAPGWSYVVDTGYDPSKAAINPTNRKRVRNSVAGGNTASDLSSRQQTAVLRHLMELDKDSLKEIEIPVPRSSSEASKKQTPNVRRILTSGKNFAYYVEEEASLGRGGAGAVAGAGQVGDSVDTLKAPGRPSKAAATARRRSTQTLRRESTDSSPAPSARADSSAPMGPPPLPVGVGQQRPAPALPVPSLPTLSGPASDLLPQPAPGIVAGEIEALLSAPPLAYNAACSAPPSASAPPPRVFCEMCGYWGRAKCLKCGARICGVDCREAHDESRCLRF
ncbi:hypothetical protein H2203_007623 [Taxawa tesnikishii (nom. ined.)]|nr:hypothetical protein H2203_007623 [Dothideales sp. JES 119]